MWSAYESHSLVGQNPCGFDILLFPEFTIEFLHIVHSPVGTIIPFTQITKKRRILPINRPSYISVFNGIVVDIIKMSVPVALITNNVIPETVLPHSPRGKSDSLSEIGRDRELHPSNDVGWTLFSKVGKDMEVIRQNNPRLSLRIPFALGFFNRQQEQIDVVHAPRRSPLSNMSKKASCAGRKVSTKFRYFDKISSGNQMSKPQGF